MYRLEILPTAWKDLEKIEDWYAEQFSVEVAIKVSESILNSVGEVIYIYHIADTRTDYPCLF